MARFRICAAAVLAGVTFSASASAAILTLTANLTTSAEPTLNGLTTTTGDPRPMPFGMAEFILNTSLPQMSMMVTITNIDVTGTQTEDPNDNLLAAHIHVGTPADPMPLTFPVRWGFFGAPDNDNSPDQLVVTPFASGVGGTFTSIWDAPEGNAGTTLATNLPNILAGGAYLNFHTVQNPGGEIRGTLQVVPEPSTIALMAGGFALLGIRFARRRSG